MATNPTTALPPRRQVWNIMTGMLIGTFLLGGETCKLVMPGAPPWFFFDVFLLACSVVMVAGGLSRLLPLIRCLEHGPADGAARN